MKIVRIHGNHVLDEITIYFDDLSFGRAYITVHCYGTSWTCYFGAMNDDAETFFKRCDAGYLTGKLSRTDEPKKTFAYLARIVNAIKEHYADEAAISASLTPNPGAQPLPAGETK